jgi:hypothetical protein
MTTPAEASRGMCDGGTGWDGDRLAHNPEVEGSNPAPATSFRRSRPFSSRERAFCVSDVVLSRVAKTRLRAAWQRDGGDGVTRDETAWTWWTLPSAIAGCPAQRSRRYIPLSSHSCWTCRNMRSPRFGSGSPAGCRGIWVPRAQDRPLLLFNAGVAGPPGADAAAYFL